MVLAAGFFSFFFLVGPGEEAQPVNWSSNRSDRLAKEGRGGLDAENSFIKLFINFSSVHKIKSQISWDHFSDASLILWGEVRFCGDCVTIWFIS